MLGRRLVGRALGFVVLGWGFSTSCAGKSERGDAKGANGSDASGGTSGEGGSGPSAGRGGTGAGRGGTGSSFAGRGGTSSTGGTAARSGSGGAGKGGTATGGDDSGGAGDGGASDGRSDPGVCRSPTAWSEDLEGCRDGFVHRPAATSCPVPVRDELIDGLAGNAGVESCSFDCRVVPNECTRDADCPENAICLRTYQEDADEVWITHTCHLPCANDDDCGTGSVCVCDRVVQNATRSELTMGVCTPGTCRTDSDCGVGSFCISPLNLPAYSGVGSSSRLDPVIGAFACQSGDDECFGPETCPAPPDDDCVLYSSCEEVDGRFVCGWRNESILCSP